MAYPRGLTEIDGNFKTEARLVAADVVIDSLVHIDGVPFNVDVADGGEGIALNNGLFANPVLTSPFTIRESFLDNPLVHLYTKNDLVRVLAGSSELASDRNTVATRIDINGIVRDVDIDDPREEETGWLFEGDGENLELHIEDFTNVIWGLSEVTAASNVVNAPDGALTADEITEVATNLDHTLFYNGAPQSAGTFTNTVYLKHVDAQYIALATNGVTGSNWASAVFDLINGTVTASQFNGSYTAIAASITKVSGGFFRCSITTTNTSDTARGLRVRFSNSATPTFELGTFGAIVFLGTGRKVQLWSAQFEESPFATSGIKTVATTETRSADDQSFPSAENFRESEGAIFFRADVIGDTGATQSILDITDGAGNNRITLTRFSDKIRLEIRTGGVLQSLINTSFNMEVGQQYEIALNYKDDDVELFVDGVSIDTDTSATMPTGLTIVNVGVTFAGTSELFGHIQDLRFYPEKLTISEIKHLGSN